MSLRAGEGELWLGHVQRVYQCFTSTVGVRAVKLVNPEEQGISSAGGEAASAGVSGSPLSPRPQSHALGLWGLADLPPPLPPITPQKTFPRHFLT